MYVCVCMIVYDNMRFTFMHMGQKFQISFVLHSRFKKKHAPLGQNYKEMYKKYYLLLLKQKNVKRVVYMCFLNGHG